MAHIRAYPTLHAKGGPFSPGRRGSGLAILMTSIFLGVKHAVSAMERSGGGAIVNLSSVHGLLMAPRKLVYEAGKSAVIGMTRRMTIDFGPLGIRVNAICPGHIVRGRIAPQRDAHPDGLRYFARQYPVRRTGVLEDLANAISSLCSEEASFITGRALAVDGGLTLELQEDLAVDGRTTCASSRIHGCRTEARPGLRSRSRECNFVR